MNPAERDQLCQLYVEALTDESEADPLASLAEALPARASPRPAVGQLWRLVREGRPAQSLVALTHLSDVARGVVTSADTFLAATDDVLVPASDSPTGEALALHVWLDAPVRTDALQGFVGALPTHVVDALLMLLQRRLTGGFVLRAQETLDSAGPEALRWSIAPRDAADHGRTFVTGSRIVDPSDGRVAARAALRRAVAWIAEDALAAVSGEMSETPWHRAFADRLRKVLRELNASFDVSESEFESAESGALGIGALGGGLMGGMLFMPSIGLLGAAVSAVFGGATTQPALRQSPTEQSDESVTFALPLGDARVALKIHVREGEIDLFVVARVDGRPRRGVKVTVRVDGASVGPTRVTDRGGVASLAGISVKPGARVEMEFSHGRVKHLVSVA